MNDEKKVPTSAKRRLTNAIKKARKSLKELDTATEIELEAIEAAKKVQMIVGVECYKEGKVSPFGHRVLSQNGRLDLALLKGEDILGCLRAMMRGNQTQTKRPLQDNRALVLRAQEHVRYLSGRTKSGRRLFRSRLEKIGLQERADEIMQTMKPIARYFDAMTKAGTY